MARHEVTVIGGGITGLAAAFELTGGARPLGEDGPKVTVLEASDHFGGKLGATTIAGVVVDAGPDGVLARRREAATLLEDLGRADLLVPIDASGASVFARGQLRPLPDGMQLGVPTSWRTLRSSHLLSTAGLLRALVDVVAPRPASRGHLQDRTIGGLVETKLGHEVVATLVDPMLGGITAGRVAEMSAAAVFPQLLEAGQERGSLMKALQGQMAAAAPPPPPDGEPRPVPPAFVTPVTGMHSIPTLLVEELTRRGVTFLADRQVTALRRRGGSDPGWSVDTDQTTTSADGVIITTPTDAAAELLRPHDVEAASLLDQTEYSSVAVVTFAFPKANLTLPTHGTGALVPPGTQHRRGPLDGRRYLTTAVTFLDRKWPHLATKEMVLLRASVGRIDDERLASLNDDEVIEIVGLELAELFGTMPAPIDVTVTRWMASLPQYRVNHLLRVGGIESAVDRLHGVEIAGAAYRGVGVPACIASGRQAAARLSELLARG